ncbi:MAG: SUMF1/EgtB/PvdO family nonheme iron enzyme [Planctomycetaceae bacterium]
MSIRPCPYPIRHFHDECGCSRCGARYKRSSVRRSDVPPPRFPCAGRSLVSRISRLVFNASRTGFLAMAVFATAAAQGVTIDWVTVGNAGNAADTTGYGAVGYQYQIGKYEVTIQQYADFLNAVAASDPYGLYNSNMGSDQRVAGISRAGVSGGYTYSVVSPAGVAPAGADSPGNRPITWVSWFDAARFTNWMNNGQGSASTESGAYTMSTGQITAASRTGGVNTYTLSAPSTLSVGDQVSVSGLGGTAFNVRGIVTSVAGSQFTMANTNSNAVATGTGSMTGVSATAATNAAFSIPTEDEWYKAAYYSPVKGGVGTPGYYTYATLSDTRPDNTIGGSVNQANWYDGAYAVTQTTFAIGQNYLTNAGAFTNSFSYYGTFDQNGNVGEFNAAITGTTSGSPGSLRGSRGGVYNEDQAAYGLSSADRGGNSPAGENWYTGFRLAAPVAVPEPATCFMSLTGLACGGFSVWRRRAARMAGHGR